ncbi:MAG: SLBB domain-containing protein, partial [Actinomycetia bacterium]|nr:SLBB domain-containing protein [Actinomycetes bacterium]
MGKVKKTERTNINITVGLSSCGVAAGAVEVFEAFKKELKKSRIRAELKKTGCVGMCYKEVLVNIEVPGRKKVVYGEVTSEIVPAIVDKHLKKGMVLSKYLVLKEGQKIEDIDFFKWQKRAVLMNCGRINPEDIKEYTKVGGYQAIKKVIGNIKPVEVIKKIKKSGLRGRGGAGFPTGLKWQFVQEAKGETKYVICNADEGDPGAFMDRSILEADPHLVLEGMIIAGYAINAQKGFIYVRAEYPLAVKRLKIAIEQAKEKEFLGKSILGSSFDFDIEIFQGAGAFVCGESTALIASIEGKRGMPKSLPRPRTTEAGLWNKPTLLNNVKTFAYIPLIIVRGAEWFNSIGTDNSKGTAVFALTGKVANCGLIEVPMGITLREIIFGIGGGIPDGKAFKAVQIGGPSGGCLSKEHLDIPIDFKSLDKVGAMMGSGGMVVMDEETCMVDVSKFFLSFTQSESCGKCPPCRIGT